MVGVALRRAGKRGAKIITIHPRHHNLAMIADQWLQPRPNEVVGLLRNLCSRTDSDGGKGVVGSESTHDARHEQEMSAIANLIKSSSPVVILVGSEFLQYDASAEILKQIARIARNVKAGVLPLPSHNNLYGSIVMGAYGEILPGGHPTTDNEPRSKLASQWGVELRADKPQWNAMSLSGETRLKVLYLIGEVPLGWEPNADFVIFQNIYPPDGFGHADLVLPSAAFTEVEGSFINGEGRVQPVRKAVEPPGGALPDWQILCRIARKMGVAGFDFASVEKIHEEVAQVAGRFGRFEEITREPNPLRVSGEFCVGESKSKTTGVPSKEFPFLLTVSAIEHSHRGFPLSSWVEGSKMLLTEGILEMNPEDAKVAGIVSGDEVVVTSAHLEKVLPVRLVREQQPGTVHASLREFARFNPNPQPVRIRRQPCSK